jgi:Planctomycete cytochrome C
MNKLTPLLIAGIAATTWSVLAADGDKHDEWDVSKLDASKLPPAATTTGLTYAKDVKPILEASCFRCHGEDRQKGDLRMDSLEALLKGGEDGKVVEPGQSAKSLILFAAAQVNDDVAMPPKRRPGGPGGPRGFQPPPEILKKYDKNGDGKLDEAERRAMFEDFRAQRGQRGPGGPGGPPRGGPQGRRGGPGGGPPPKPLTPEQVGILRAWIEQGAK